MAMTTSRRWFISLCYVLLLEGYNGDVMRVTLKPIERTTVITAAHTQERIELLSQAKAHGSIFSATGGIHLTANDIFLSIALTQRKILREKLGKDKTLRERQEKNKSVALDILQRKGENPTTLTGTNLTALLTWHQHLKVASLKKDAKFVAWMEIKRRGRPPPQRLINGPTTKRTVEGGPVRRRRDGPHCARSPRSAEKEGIIVGRTVDDSRGVRTAGSRTGEVDC